MKTIGELNLGFSDAQNYAQRENRFLFSSIFVKNHFLDDLLKPQKYFLIGEKGIGKTAYAVFLCNNEYKNNKGILKNIIHTDYEKFYKLKQDKQLSISGYVDIWKTILLLLLAESIKDNEQIVSILDRAKLDYLMEAIDEYYNRAFSPEIQSALQITDNSELAAKLIFKHLEASGQMDNKIVFDEKRFQMNLHYISKQFSDCLGILRLKRNVTLFIDGIDIRPTEIPYSEYLDCIKGLVTASWSLNTELFPNIADSGYHFRIVLLLRPDIFSAINLQNATNKLIDNSVYLDWRTNYNDYFNSDLFRMTNKLLEYDQNYTERTPIWSIYFDDFQKECIRQDAFIEFLRISLCRPRDILVILKYLQEIMNSMNLGGSYTFDYQAYNSDGFQNMYSEYFLSSLKDQLEFYYSEEDFKYFKDFFSYFQKPFFSFKQYQAVFEQFITTIRIKTNLLPEFMRDSSEFLQMLYDSSVIYAIEKTYNKSYVHFSYREKSGTNISPEVWKGDNIEYGFHFGLYKKGRWGRF